MDTCYRVVKRLLFAQTLYNTHTQNSVFFRALTPRYIREMHEWSTSLRALNVVCIYTDVAIAAG